MITSSDPLERLAGEGCPAVRSVRVKESYLVDRFGDNDNMFGVVR